MNFRKINCMILLLIVGIVSAVQAQTSAIYHYGTSNQLIEVRHSDCTVISYAYDKNGNRTERIVEPCPVISGYVLTPEELGIGGVVLNGLPGNPSTDSSGFYSVQVEPGWSGTVAPQKEDYSFEPLERSYENLTGDRANQNYTGTLPQYTLTVEVLGEGTVEGDGGIDCPGVCRQTFDKHTQVSFSALPAEGYRFERCPQAACSEDGNCTVTILEDTTVTVTFAEAPPATPTPIVTPDPTATPDPNVTPEPVPEPGTIVLLGLGLLGLLRLVIRRPKR